MGDASTLVTLFARLAAVAAIAAIRERSMAFWPQV
jgi:hypothetical protein